MPDSRGGQGALERDMRAGARTGSGRSGEAERRSGRAGSTMLERRSARPLLLMSGWAGGGGR